MLGKRSGLKGSDHHYLDHVGRDSFYGFLASHWVELFRDEDFTDLYCSDNGRPSVPPSLLATALVLKAYEGVSDEEAKGRADFDLCWKVALGVGLEERLLPRVRGSSPSTPTGPSGCGEASLAAPGSSASRPACGSWSWPPSSEEDLTEERGTGETIRATPVRIAGYVGRGRSAGPLAPTPSTPEKRRRDRLICLAEHNADWALGSEDETWWSQFAQPMPAARAVPANRCACRSGRSPRMTPTLRSSLAIGSSCPSLRRPSCASAVLLSALSTIVLLMLTFSPPRQSLI